MSAEGLSSLSNVDSYLHCATCASRLVRCCSLTRTFTARGVIVPQLAKWRDNGISLSEVPHALEIAYLQCGARSVPDADWMSPEGVSGHDFQILHQIWNDHTILAFIPLRSSDTERSQGNDRGRWVRHPSPLTADWDARFGLVVERRHSPQPQFLISPFGALPFNGHPRLL